jgi:uncharacterized repeat protein (TIGR03809 family)
MADREFKSSVPRTLVLAGPIPAARKWQRVVLKWRRLAEQRHSHLLDLYNSGRWHEYYTDEEFLIEMRDAVAVAERWARMVRFAEEPDVLDETGQANAA